MGIENMDISPELREKAKACTSPEELLALAKREGYKLSDAEMEAVAGGTSWTSPNCSSHDSPYDGDTRTDIDPAQVRAEFLNGAVDGGELD